MQKEAAERLRVSYPRMNEIVNGKRTVTPDTALRLARFTDTEPEFWLNLQQAVDLWDAMHSDRSVELDEIKPAQVAGVRVHGSGENLDIGWLHLANPCDLRS